MNTKTLFIMQELPERSTPAREQVPWEPGQPSGSLGGGDMLPLHTRVKLHPEDEKECGLCATNWLQRLEEVVDLIMFQIIWPLLFCMRSTRAVRVPSCPQSTYLPLH